MRKIIYGENTLTIDEGIFFGKGIFETILWDEKPILYDKHIERLKFGMNILGLEKLEEKELNDFLYKLDIKNEIVKILVTPKNILITKRKSNYSKEDYQKGFSLKVGNVRRNSTSNLCYIKSINYIENIIEKNKAIEEGYDDVLFLNENNMITETSCANIFIIKNNNIQTPRVKNGLLNGIIRSFIINNFQVDEVDLTLEAIKAAEEVFITNSVVGIMPIVKVDKIQFGERKVSQEIAEKYEEIRVRLGGNKHGR